MADQVVITDEGAVKTIEKYAEQKGISKAEAGAKLVNTAKGRINAVRKYAAAHAPAPKPKKEKAPKVKKAAKAKAAAPVRRRKAKEASDPAAAPAAAPQQAAPVTASL